MVCPVFTIRSIAPVYTLYVIPESSSDQDVVHSLTSVQLNALFSDSQRELEATSQQLQSTTESLVATQDQLAVTQTNLHKTREDRDEKGFLVEEHVRNEQTLITEAEEVKRYSKKASISLCVVRFALVDIQIHCRTNLGWMSKLLLEQMNTKFALMDSWLPIYVYRYYMYMYNMHM